MPRVQPVLPLVSDRAHSTASCSSTAEMRNSTILASPASLKRTVKCRMEAFVSGESGPTGPRPMGPCRPKAWSMPVFSSPLPEAIRAVISSASRAAIVKMAVLMMPSSTVSSTRTDSTA